MCTCFEPYRFSRPFRYIQRLLLIYNGKLFKSHQKPHMWLSTLRKKKNPFGFFFLRRVRDLNPRCPFRHTVFPGLRTRPLCEPSQVLRPMSEDRATISFRKNLSHHNTRVLIKKTRVLQKNIWDNNTKK